MLKVRAESGCPLFEAGDQMVLHLPGVEIGASTAVCALTLAKFLSEVQSHDCPDTMSPMSRGTMYCPRAERPVMFDVETVAETHTPMPVVSAATADLPATVALLRHLQVFKALSATVLGELASSLRLERYAQGAILLEKGQPGRSFFILTEGEIEAVDHTDESGARVIRVMSSPASFGELSLLTGSPTATRIIARSDVTVLVLAGEHFHRMLRDQPPLAHRFIRVLANQVENANSHIIREGNWGFRGKLSVMGLSTVLQVLAEARRSGRLHLVSGSQSAFVAYNQGRIYAAKYGELDGPNAIYALLEWETGDFWLENEPVPPIDEVGMGVMGLLLEGMRRIDENRPL